jgi:hypothetical protein
LSESIKKYNITLMPKSLFVGKSIIACIFYLALLTASFSFSSIVLAADTTAPVTSYVQTPSTPDGSNGWYKSVVRFDLTSSDLESGVSEINYKIDTNPWVKTTFNNSLNLVSDPSFELQNGSWQGSFTYDSTVSHPSFPSKSAKISATSEGWTFLSNESSFAVTSSYSNMTASALVRTENVTGSVYFKIIALHTDAGGNQTETQVVQSGSVTGTSDWTSLSTNFVVNVENAVGVFMEIGVDGTGTVWVDGVNISNTASSSEVSFTVGSDSNDHVIQFYAVDLAGNSEPIQTVNFKQDTTPPSNWHDSGAFRGVVGPSAHHLYVYTMVEDATSGLSTLTDKYQYHTDRNPGYGSYSDVMSCASTWRPNVWIPLISPPFLPGVKSAYLLTPKTDFCNEDWKTCKTVKFYAEDLAGNSSTKDMCINGPWIKLRGNGVVRSNNIIDMLSEASEDNTDGLVEISGSIINFFSTNDLSWKLKNSPKPVSKGYDDYIKMVSSPTNITGQPLRTSNGAYIIEGNYTVGNTQIPSGFSSNTFNQVVFVNGDLTIDKDISVSSASTALFIVKGNVNIEKKVEQLGVGIIADGNFNTSYNISEGEASKTLHLKGVFGANKFIFLRTLQGTNNSDTPSEEFTYEPKYLTKTKALFGDYKVKWLPSD